MSPLVKVDDDGDVLCSWFIGCSRLAEGVTFHPVLGYVPICKLCADHCEVLFTPTKVVVS